VVKVQKVLRQLPIKVLPRPCYLQGVSTDIVEEEKLLCGPDEEGADVDSINGDNLMPLLPHVFREGCSSGAEEPLEEEGG